MAAKTDRDLLEEISSNVAMLTERMTNTCKDVAQLDTDINGDGQTGLKGDVQSLKTKMSLITFIGAAISTSAIGAVVTAVWALLRGK